MMKFFKWVGIFVGGLFLLGIIGAIFSSPKKEGGMPSSPAANIVPAEPPVTVTAVQLFNDYDANEVAADEKFKGKRLLVTGTVQSIDKGAFNNIVISLRTPNEFMAVHASFDNEHEKMAASLKKGVKVNWICDGEGRIIGSPILKNCAPST